MPFFRRALGLLIRLPFRAAEAQTVPDFGAALCGRNIGPHRGGRVRAISGAPSPPNVFSLAQIDGGVFQSNDCDRTWRAIFEDQPVAE